jgi:hypothetical protein
MGQYIIEVLEMNGRDWVYRGFHRSGSNTPGDPFHIGGKSTALKMTEDFARRRVEMYRKFGNRARILDSDDRVILDFDDPLTKPQELDRWNQHEILEHRGLRLVHDRATGAWHHRWAWPVKDGPERIVTSDSPEGIVSRLQELGGDVPAYLAAVLDKPETLPQPVAQAPVIPANTPMYTVPPGTVEVSFSYRPGSIRS